MSGWFGALSRCQQRWACGSASRSAVPHRRLERRGDHLPRNLTFEEVVRWARATGNAGGGRARVEVGRDGDKRRTGNEVEVAREGRAALEGR